MSLSHCYPLHSLRLQTAELMVRLYSTTPFTVTAVIPEGVSHWWIVTLMSQKMGEMLLTCPQSLCDTNREVAVSGDYNGVLLHSQVKAQPDGRRPSVRLCNIQQKRKASRRRKSPISPSETARRPESLKKACCCPGCSWPGPRQTECWQPTILECLVVSFACPMYRTHQS